MWKYLCVERTKKFLSCCKVNFASNYFKFVSLHLNYYIFLLHIDYKKKFFSNNYKIQSVYEWFSIIIIIIYVRMCTWNKNNHHNNNTYIIKFILFIWDDDFETRINFINFFKLLNTLVATTTTTTKKLTLHITKKIIIIIIFYLSKHFSFLFDLLEK